MSTEAFFFGSQHEQLFGIHHQPPARTRSGRAVVLCYPFGREYVRGHRSFRQLAILLVRSGFDVLRFDYYGSGDSAGDSEAGRPGLWIDNVAQASLELARRCGAERVSLVGLRLGAMLATLATARLAAVEDLVLWDPVSVGADYVEELKELHRNWLVSAMHQLPVETEAYQRAAATSAALNGGDPFECIGFPITSGIRRELEALRLHRLSSPVPRRVLILETADEPKLGPLKETLSSGNTPCSHLHHPARSVWLGTADALVPGELLRALVGWLSEAAA